MKNKKGVLIILSGASGTGKGTICKRVTEDRDDVFLSVSQTTRSPREGEIDGVSYYFSSKDEFEKKIKNGEMIEYAQFCGNYYGTPKKPVEERLSRGESVILEIEVQGAMQVKEKIEDAVLVFVVAPSEEELEKRLRGRGTESDEVIRTRLARAKEELGYAAKYDYILCNDNLESAVHRFEAIIDAEMCRVSRNNITY